MQERQPPRRRRLGLIVRNAQLLHTFGIVHVILLDHRKADRHPGRESLQRIRLPNREGHHHGIHVARNGIARNQDDVLDGIDFQQNALNGVFFRRPDL